MVLFPTMIFSCHGFIPYHVECHLLQNESPVLVLILHSQNIPAEDWLSINITFMIMINILIRFIISTIIIIPYTSTKLVKANSASERKTKTKQQMM